MVEEWLLRDGGKHQFNPEHKQMLMEHVAAELTRSGGRSWSAGQLEQWLITFLEAHLALHYSGVKARSPEGRLAHGHVPGAR